MNMYFQSVSAVALLTAISINPASAQDTGTLPQPADRSEQAAQCRQGLQALGQRMQDDGYWLSGWRSGTAGAMPMDGAPATDGMAAGVGASGADGTGTAGASGGMAGTNIDPTAPPPASAVGPWGSTGWQERPQLAIQTLFRAANVLAQRGDQQTCQSVLAATEEVYQEYSAKLKELGVDPQQVSGWRQEQLVLARPITEIASTVRADDVIGSDVRNGQDASLGSVEDVVMDPKSGQIRYVVVSQGGLLGLGGRQVPVPWEHLHATPGLETMVLPVSEEVMNKAPEIPAGGTQGQGNQQIDQYWTQAVNEQQQPAQQ